MAHLFQRKYAKTVNGERVVKTSRKWYGFYVDENDVERRVPLSTNKVAAQQMLAELVKQVEFRRAKLPVEAMGHARRPLAEHLTDYEQTLLSRGIPAEHVRQTLTRLRAVVQGCGFVFPPDIKAPAVRIFLVGLRKDPPRPEVPVQDTFTPAELGELLG